MKKALIIGGTSGIGLSIAYNLLDRGYSKIVSYGRISKDSSPVIQDKRIEFFNINLVNGDFSFLDNIDDSFDTLIITCGFGRVAPFEWLLEKEIQNLIVVNYMAIATILRRFYHRIKSENDFYTLVIGSISGHVASPLFSVYGSAKAGLCSLIENLNIELKEGGYRNRIMDVSPGLINGSGFNGEKTNLKLLSPLSNEILNNLFLRRELFIPNYHDVYKNVIERYKKDSKKFGKESYHYKISNGRLVQKPQLIVGYLSGTFDLFHIGHLNILKRAKEQCDYLIVGVHESGAWKGKETFIPFEERIEIIRSIKYVDEVCKSFDEDSDAWNIYHFDKLFVGDDYKGSDRFKNYEKFFEDKNVDIVFFPYTKGTSSTKLREKLTSSKN